jgi:hypothetical protein
MSMKGGRMNWPFVAIAATAIVGLIVGGYVVATGPPLNQVITYTAVTETALTPGTGILNEAWAECSPGDNVTGGGYELIGMREWGIFAGGGGDYRLLSSHPYRDEAAGVEGWRVTVVLTTENLPNADPPPPKIRVWAICLHQVPEGPGSTG